MGKPGKDGWIRWQGGKKAPLPVGTHYEARYRCGRKFKSKVTNWADEPEAWAHIQEDDDIMAYRVIGEPIVNIEVIHGVEVDWGKAPEGTTHAVILRDEFHGWRKHTPEVVYRWEEEQWLNSGYTPHIWLDINKHCIFEGPWVRGVKVQYQEVRPEQPKPAPKKQVGWW